jgi:hypothetical protein
LKVDKKDAPCGAHLFVREVREFKEVKDITL